MIPYGRHDISDADVEVVKAILRSDYLTQGPTVPRFEVAVANHVSAKYAIAVNSATSALHIACLSLGLGERDWLWTSPITFVASANCGVYCGARIDFVDIDSKTYNICPIALEIKLIAAQKRKLLPKVLVVVHLCGQSADMQSIYRLSQIYGFKIIEDASHAIGGRYKNQNIGCSKYSDITVFSFHPVKIITTGEGGMALTNSESLAQKMKLLRSHGITREIDLMVNKTGAPWHYEQIDLGFNYRMTDIQAALGLSQLSRLDDFVMRRHELAQFYNEGLDGLPLRLPYQINDSYSSFHLYVIRLNLDIVKKTRRQIFDDLKKIGIGVNLHYIPVYRQPFYVRMGFNPINYPNSEAYYSEAITLPLYSSMVKSQQEFVVSGLREVLLN
jgi:UDP-4-amino-4,6-dideoxy-N-acetyl-beta-L-altrosamine transaminase